MQRAKTNQLCVQQKLGGYSFKSCPEEGFIFPPKKSFNIYFWKIGFDFCLFRFPVQCCCFPSRSRRYPSRESDKAESLDSYTVLLGQGLEQSRCEYPDGNCFKLTASPSLFIALEYKVQKFRSNISFKKMLMVVSLNIINTQCLTLKL